MSASGSDVKSGIDGDEILISIGTALHLTDSTFVVIVIDIERVCSGR